MIDVMALTGRPVNPLGTTFAPDIHAPLLPDCAIKRTLMDTAGQFSGAIYSDSGVSGGNWSHNQIHPHRYALWRVWEQGKLPLVVIGLNPSTATELVDDPTVRRDTGYARLWGFGGLVKLNLFSYRSTAPGVLKLIGVPPNVDPATGGVTNDDYLKWFTSPKQAGLVLLAWGNHGGLFGRGQQVVKMLRQNGVPVFALRVTKQGHPEHTLYLPKNLLPEPFQLF